MEGIEHQVKYAFTDADASESKIALLNYVLEQDGEAEFV
jgi:hypothetical protein